MLGRQAHRTKRVLLNTAQKASKKSSLEQSLLDFWWKGLVNRLSVVSELFHACRAWFPYSKGMNLSYRTHPAEVQRNAAATWRLCHRLLAVVRNFWTWISGPQFRHLSNVLRESQKFLRILMKTFLLPKSKPIHFVSLISAAWSTGPLNEIALSTIALLAWNTKAT